MARKKEERAKCAAQKKEKKAERYLSDDENLANFTAQLNKLGLELRDIPGDGNCLFRALGDQVDGHSRCHLTHRHDVVKYMSEHRADFEPFVEDDVPFERHVLYLSSPGTYAGNDAIVAFARLHQLTVVIHQLNSPMWEIHGASKPTSRQIHISYHNGDHYSSVRCIGDVSECPNSIRFMNGKVVGSDGQALCTVTKSVVPASSVVALTRNGWRNTNDTDDVLKTKHNAGSDEGEGSEGSNRRFIKNVALVTGCRDKKLISEMWRDNDGDFESTVDQLKIVMSGSTTPPDVGSDQLTTSSDSDTSTPSPETLSLSGQEHGGEVGAKAKTKQMSKSRQRRERKSEKKAKAVERHRQKIVSESAVVCGTGRGGRLGARDSSAAGCASSEEDETTSATAILTTTVITENLKVLQI